MSEAELKEIGFNRFRWYIDLVEEKHAGCGIGFNRITQGMLKCPDIRAATSFPLNREILM
jgi:aspartyl/asparaginyl-tRNA synthetase